MKTLLENRFKRARGQSTVEFALMFPIFLGVFLGLVAFSMLFYSYVTLQLAVREGAGYLVTHTNQSIYSVRSTVCNSGFAFDQSKLYVLVEPPDSATSSPAQCSNLNTNEGPYTSWYSGAQVTVVANYTVPLPSFTVPLISGGSAVIIAPIQIQATSIMTVE